MPESVWIGRGHVQVHIWLQEARGRPELLRSDQTPGVADASPGPDPEQVGQRLRTGRRPAQTVGPRVVGASSTSFHDTPVPGRPLWTQHCSRHRGAVWSCSPSEQQSGRVAVRCHHHGNSHRFLSWLSFWPLAIFCHFVGKRRTLLLPGRNWWL